MTPCEFEILTSRLAARLRLRRAAVHTVLPGGLVLGMAAAALAAMRLGGLAGQPAGLALAAGAVLCALALPAAVWLLRPVSKLAAAVEIDRLTRLKERAATLAAIRAGAVRAGRLAAELEADAGLAMAPLDADEVLGRVAPLPGSARWLAVLLAVLLGALLLPARGAGRRLSLADVLVGGGELTQVLDSAASGADGVPEGAARAAKRALALVKAPPPRDPEEARLRAELMKRLAAELRSRGAETQAERLEQAARAIWNEAATRAADSAVAPDAGADRFPGRDRYPAEYAGLIARYFSGAGG